MRHGTTLQAPELLYDAVAVCEHKRALPGQLALPFSSTPAIPLCPARELPQWGKKPDLEECSDRATSSVPVAGRD